MVPAGAGSGAVQFGDVVAGAEPVEDHFGAADAEPPASSAGGVADEQRGASVGAGVQVAVDLAAGASGDHYAAVDVAFAAHDDGVPVSVAAI